MKLNCNIVDDLLPLYLEDMCSADSVAAVEEHLQECPACREKLTRMKNSELLPAMEKPEGQPPMVQYARKVRRHRARVVILIALLSVLAVGVLTLCGLTVMDMHRQANPTVHEVEDGVCNLTAEELECPAEVVGQYVFYTNSTRIRVTVQGAGDYQGTVMLWSTEDSDNYIQMGEVDDETSTVTFTGCSAARRYRITCDHLEEAAITVSEGRTISFWNSMWNVLQEIF